MVPLLRISRRRNGFSFAQKLLGTCICRFHLMVKAVSKHKNIMGIVAITMRYKVMHFRTPLLSLKKGKALFWLVGQESHSWFLLLCFCDLVSAQLIGSIGKIQFEKKSKWFIWAWLNPLAIIATGGLSQGSISNTIILACWFLTIEGLPVSPVLLSGHKKRVLG